jgi:hypothetical protein
MAAAQLLKFILETQAWPAVNAAVMVMATVS